MLRNYILTRYTAKNVKFVSKYNLKLFLGFFCNFIVHFSVFFFIVSSQSLKIMSQAVTHTPHTRTKRQTASTKTLTF